MDASVLLPHATATHVSGNAARYAEYASAHPSGQFLQGFGFSQVFLARTGFWVLGFGTLKVFLAGTRESWAARGSGQPDGGAVRVQPDAGGAGAEGGAGRAGGGGERRGGRRSAGAPPAPRARGRPAAAQLLQQRSGCVLPPSGMPSMAFAEDGAAAAAVPGSCRLLRQRRGVRPTGGLPEVRERFQPNCPCQVEAVKGVVVNVSRKGKHCRKQEISQWTCCPHQWLRTPQG